MLSVQREDAPRKKRKASPTELRETDDDVLGTLIDALSEACNNLTVSLRETTFELHEVINEDNLAELRRAVQAIMEYSKTVKNRSPCTRPMNAAKPAMVNATTDTELTPH